MNRRFLLAALLSIGALAVLILLMRDEPLSIFGGGPAEGEKLVVYCAAGINPPIEDILKDYERQYRIKRQTKFAGSGQLLGDIRLAEVDVFVAADRKYLLDARRQGLVREIIPLARQRPTIAVLKGNPKKIASLDDLNRTDVRVSLANPEVAAIGKIVQQKLKDDPVWQVIRKREVVERATVNEVANDVKSGGADAGIVWDATASQIPDLEAIDVPELADLESDICIGVVTQSPRPARALHFARYASARDKGLLYFKNRGYRVVAGDKWAERPVLQMSAGAMTQRAVERTIQEFQKREGVEVGTIYDGCGQLVGGMKAGARPDVYLACDRPFMDMVHRADLNLFFDPRNVSRTAAVIITQKGNPKGLRTLEDLSRKGLRLALCDSHQSALGALTDALLTKRGILEQVRRNAAATNATADRCVENVVVGGLDAAIVYRVNTTLQREKLEVIAIDDPLAYAVQPIAVGRNSDYPNLAGRLMEAILSAQSQEQFQQNGFEWLGETSPPAAQNQSDKTVGRSGG
ncbi:MAG: substrate-binding domain-containing protein [Planctomycetia bacterium]|nr:substrate-binding domain-containing protein [Planctomycetia bacterium]